MRRKLKTNRVETVQIASNMYIAQKYNVLLYSYETPVREDHNASFWTDTHYSSTTTRHINKCCFRKMLEKLFLISNLSEVQL